MTKIEWTDETWNPVTGCTKVSQGCKNCYAERMAYRLAGRFGYPERPNQFKVTLHPDLLEKPLKWKKPRMIFVNSMSDLFHPDVPKCFIDQVLEVIAATPQHTYQVLTKRPELMLEKLYGYDPDCPARELGGGDYLPNLWIGVSVEDQKTADERILWLLRTPAAVRFVSCEPMLEKIDIGDYIELLDWVIAGCESGQKRRRAEISWFTSLRDQCLSAYNGIGIPFFLKQVEIDGAIVKMPSIDGGIWAQFPEVTND